MKTYRNDKETRKDALAKFLRAQTFEVGDIVLTRLPLPVFREIAALSNSWANHIGVIVDATPGAEVIAESTFPRSMRSELMWHAWRSDFEHFVAIRPKKRLNDDEKRGIVIAADERMNRFYQVWFNMETKMQYCSKFVYEVYKAIGRDIGVVETPREIFNRNPDGPIWLFRLWFLGMIPWDRRMITPASILQDPSFDVVCEYEWRKES